MKKHYLIGLLDLKHKNLLSEMSNKIKLDGASKEFDCIIGMSGGIDGSYLVYA